MEAKGGILCLSMLYPRDNKLKDHPLQPFKETSNPYNMYIHEAMKELDQR